MAACWKLLVAAILLRISSAFQGAFWLISDVHVNLNYSMHGDALHYCYLRNGSGQLGYYGDHSCDPPHSLLASSLNFIRKNLFKEGFILWTGDNGPHNRNTVTRDSLLLSIKNTTTSMQMYLPNSTILPVLGNHDVYPKDQYSPKDGWCRSLAEVWSKMLMRFPDAFATFKKGCYYEALFHDKQLRIVVLNTLIYYRFNNEACDSLYEDPTDQLLWLKRRLVLAKTDNAKVIIVTHIPLGASEISPFTYRHLFPHYNNRLIELFRNYSSVILFALSAHEHTDTFRIIGDKDGNALLPYLLSPSVTPYYLHQVGWSIPAVRRMHYDDQMLRNLEQFHFNLSLANRNYRPTMSDEEAVNSSLSFWSRQYQLNESYDGLFAAGAPVSAWETLASRLGESTVIGKSSYHTYVSHHLGGGEHDYKVLDPRSVCRNYCAIKNLAYVDLDVCLEERCSDDLADKLSVPLTLFIIVLFCGGLVISSLMVNKACCQRRYHISTGLYQSNAYDLESKEEAEDVLVDESCGQSHAANSSGLTDEIIKMAQDSQPPKAYNYQRM